MTKSTLYTTMQLIADLLNFNEDQEVLSEHIKQTSVDWDAFVIVGSKYLMLPALYCQLKSKGLLPLIPDDLTIYLEEITSINRGRNEVLLAEAREISEILNKEHINHVFIKGIALIAGQTFKNHAERMIGDIDILIAANQLNIAFNILTQYGYTDTVTSVLERKYHRHLPRQISKEKYGAIELHSEILIDKYRHLIINEEVLKNKRIIDGIAVPSIEDNIKTTILAFQINDRAHYYGYLSFKTVYDCLALQLPSKPILLKQLADEKHSQSFLIISSIFFKELTPYKLSNYSKLLKFYFVQSLDYPRLRQFVYPLIYTYRNIQIRLHLLFHDKSYRRRVLIPKIEIKIK